MIWCILQSSRQSLLVLLMHLNLWHIIDGFVGGLVESVACVVADIHGLVRWVGCHLQGLVTVSLRLCGGCSDSPVMK